MTERHCPRNGAPLTADLKHGVWRCPREACFQANGGEAGIGHHGIKSNCLIGEHGDEEYTAPMSAAEVMRLSGVPELFKEV